MNRPTVTLKLATSLDGRIATASGESRWITGEEARTAVQAMRAAHEAVAVGSGTALADDPLLTARVTPPPPQQPWRVVFDRSLRLPATAQLVQTINQGPVAVIGHGSKPALVAAGVTLIAVPADAPVAVMLAALLAETGVRSVFVEGGGQLAASLIAAECVDRLEWMRAPMLLGAKGRPAVDSLPMTSLDQAPRFQRIAVRELGPDLHETYVRSEH
jgi:diaminohydroxyphosphoribosylaminopyrimidine deaminase/5-amino-6-(5-phosphoribosylamino)uracil reductase